MTWTEERDEDGHLISITETRKVTRAEYEDMATALRADRQRAAKQRGGRSAAAVARKKPRDLKSATGESRVPFSGAFAGNMDRRGK